MTEHTPVPWVAEPEEASDHRGIAITAPGNGWIVATILPEDDRRADAIDWANARLIVRAVNAHEDLLEALREARADILDPNKGPSGMAPAIAKIDAAIAKAEVDHA